MKLSLFIILFPGGANRMLLFPIVVSLCRCFHVIFSDGLKRSRDLLCSKIQIIIIKNIIVTYRECFALRNLWNSVYGNNASFITTDDEITGK